MDDTQADVNWETAEVDLSNIRFVPTLKHLVDEVAEAGKVDFGDSDHQPDSL